MAQPVVLIVGAGDYIGAAIAKRFASGGFAVCMGRRNGDKLAPLVAEIVADGGVAHGFTMDARDEDSVAKAFKTVEDTVGPIDLVIFNVGGNVRFSILDTTARVFRKVWEMATFAGFLSGREAARYMVPRGRGAIFSPARPPVCAAMPGLLPLARARLVLGRWRNHWHGKWGQRIFTWHI